MFKQRKIINKFTVPVAVIALLIITIIGALILENLSTSQYTHLQTHDMNAAYSLAEAGVRLAYLERLSPTDDEGKLLEPAAIKTKTYTFDGGGAVTVTVDDSDNGDGVANLTSTGKINEAFRVIKEIYFYNASTGIKDAVLHITNIAGVKHGSLVKDYSGLGNDGLSSHAKSTDTTGKYKEVTDYWGNKVNVLMFDRSPAGSSDEDQNVITVPHSPSLQIGDNVQDTWESKPDDGGTVSAWVKISEPKEDDDYIGIIVQKGQVTSGWSDPSDLAGARGTFSYSLHYYQNSGDTSEDPYVLQLLIKGEGGTNRIVSADKKMGYEQWYHVLGTWGKLGMHLYINGEEVDSNSYAGPVVYPDNDNTLLYIGNQHLFGVEDDVDPDLLDFEGRLNDILLINRQIYEVEAESLFLYRNIYYMLNGVGGPDYPNNGEGKAIDSTVFQYHGVLIDGVDPNGLDRFGMPISAYVYNGAGASVSPGPADLGINDRFTVMCWVKLTDYGTPGLVFYDTKKFELWYNGAGKMDFTIFHKNQVRFTDIDIPTEGWWHFTGVWDGSKASVYINGEQHPEEKALSGSFNSYDENRLLFLGAIFGRGSRNSISGLIDDFAVYSRQITSEELTKIMSEVKGVAWSFDTTTFIDSKSSYPAGTAGGGATLDNLTAIKGNSWSFDGSNSAYVIVSPETDFLENYPFTINTWIRTSSSGPIFSMHNSDWSKYYLTKISLDGKATAGVDDGSKSFTITASAPLVNDGSWHMLTLVVSSLSIELYVDGAFTDKSEDVEFTPDLTWRFGHFDTDYFNGNIDEASIFKRALAPTEVESLYEWYVPVAP